jgi:hypothetical protein
MAIGKGIDQLTRISGETVVDRFARIKAVLDATKMSEAEAQEKLNAGLAKRIDNEMFSALDVTTWKAADIVSNNLNSVL